MLTLQEKVKIIEIFNKEKPSVRNLAKQFNIGKTQAAEIVKNKEELLKNFNSNVHPAQKRSFFKTGGLNIDKLCYDWFVKARNKNIPLSGPIIRTKAKEIAESLGYENFGASAGWLEKFRRRHNISFKAISGEAASVDPADVASFVEKVPHLIRNFEARDIYNADETGLFFRALPDKTFALKGEKCVGGKMAKERLTVLHCVNLAGEKEKLVVIGKAARPRAFKKISLNLLPVNWYSNRKAWMTNDIMTEWLSQFDRKMAVQKRKNLLFLDNAASHPRDLNLRNITIYFLPPNTTAFCQPLDQGIIQNFKIRYRTRILKHILAQMDTVANANELVKSVTVLDAIYFLNSAWQEVSCDTIKNCFKKAGFRHQPSAFDKNDQFDSEDELPLSTIAEMSKMLQQVIGDQNINPKDFLDIDKNLVLEDESIEISLPPVQEIEVESGEEDEEEAVKDSEIMSHSEALKMIKQLKSFALNNSDIKSFEQLRAVEMNFENNLAQRKTRQTSIKEFFLAANQ